MPKNIVQLAPYTAEHWDDVERIYRAGIDTGVATFETAPPPQDQFLASKIPELFFIALDPAAERLAGWVAASPASTRAAYRGVVEHSVYVDPDYTGKGIGRMLLEKLLEQAQTHGYWTVQSAIFAVNEASRALHEKTGFREVGTRERIARVSSGPYAGQWMDTVLYEARLATD